MRPRSKPSRASRSDRAERAPSGASAGALNVLVSGRQPSHHVRPVDQLSGDDSGGEAPRGIAFDYQTHLVGFDGIDVVHLTDAELVTGDSRTPPAEQTRRARRFVTDLRRTGTALVATRSNAAIRRGVRSNAEALIDEATAGTIAMRPAPQARAAGWTVIEHSHLRGRFLGYPTMEAQKGRLLFVSGGLLSPSYEAVLSVFVFADLSDVKLRVVGRVPPTLRAAVDRALGAHRARVSLREETLSDAERVREVSSAELVVVGSPDDDDELSTMMLALSLDRPILVEDTDFSRGLADEVGHEWVRLHSGRLTAATLAAAVADLGNRPPAGRPDLDARDPNAIAEKYAHVYRTAAESVASNKRRKSQ